MENLKIETGFHVDANMGYVFLDRAFLRSLKIERRLIRSQS